MRQRLPASVAAACILLSLVGAVATASLDDGGLSTYLAFLSSVFVAVGAYVGFRVPRNAIGWLIALFGLTLVSNSFLEAYGRAGLPNAEWALWWASGLWLPALIVMLVFVPLLFPEGRAPGPRWRWFGWSAVIGGLLVWLGNAFTDNLLDAYGFENPVQAVIPTSVQELGLLIGMLLVLAGIVAGVTAAVLRYRRSTGVLRQQMRWFAASTLMLIPALLVTAWANETGRTVLGPVFFLLGALGIPLAVAVAVLRYRLYEIDRIISRTVAYALVVVLLGSLFVLGAVALPNLVIGTGTAPPLVVAASTLAVAALFNPLRKRVQTWVDRRFNRSRYDASRVMDHFAGSLRDQTDSSDVVAGWVGVVSETMEPSAIGVWVRP